MRVKKGIIPLRTRHILREFQRAIKAARVFGLFINHFVLLDNHFHLIARGSLKRSPHSWMKSLGSCFGKAIRKASNHRASSTGSCGSKSRVFDSRYHLHVLKTPKEVRNAIQYVPLNKSKHERMLEYIDWFSSEYAFKDWRRLIKPGPMIEAQLEERRIRQTSE
jgi:hypothetical protein